MFSQDFSSFVQYPPLNDKDLPITFPFPSLDSPLSQASTSTRSSMSPYEEHNSSLHYFSDLSVTKSNVWKSNDGELLNDAVFAMRLNLIFVESKASVVPGVPEDFFLRTSSLYPSLSAAPSRTSTPQPRQSSSKPRSKNMKHTRQASSLSRRSSADETNASTERAPPKRRRVSPSLLPNGRPTGACTRCKKLKVLDFVIIVRLVTELPE